MLDIFKCTTSLEVLEGMLKKNADKKGYRTLLAEKAGCHRTVLSQVLSGQLSLGIDHAANLCSFWGFEAPQTEYFLSLLIKERTSSRYLRELSQRKIDHLKQESQELKSNLNRAVFPQENAMALYYSHWFYSAIHVALSIPRLQTLKALTSRFQLPEDVVEGALSQLEAWGLVEKKKDHWTTQLQHMHLPRESNMANFYHVMMRKKMSESLESGPEAFHFSSLSTLREKDFAKLKALIIQFINSLQSEIADSPAEQLYYFGLDFSKF